LFGTAPPCLPLTGSLVAKCHGGNCFAVAGVRSDG